MLYRGFPIDEETPFQFVGIHPLRWRDRREPTMGFVEFEGDLAEENARLRADLKTAQDALEAFPDWGSLSSDFSPGNEDWFRFFTELRAWDREQRHAALHPEAATDMPAAGGEGE